MRRLQPFGKKEEQKKKKTYFPQRRYEDVFGLRLFYESNLFERERLRVPIVIGLSACLNRIENRNRKSK